MANLKLRTIPKFLASIFAGTGTAVRKDGLATYVDLDYASLTDGPVSDADTAFVAVYDETSNIYRSVAFSSLLASGGAGGADLEAIEALTGTGMLARTADGTWALRTVAGTANEITVTNGDGVAGAPALSLPTSLTFTGKTVTGGTYTGAVSYTGGPVAIGSTSASALAVGSGGGVSAFVVDASTPSQLSGLKVTGAVTGGTVALAAIDSGSNTNLSINGKGSGTITLGNVSTGNIILSRALNYGGVTLNNAVTGTGNMVLSTGPTLTLTNATGLPLTTGVTGTLPVANGGTGGTTAQAAMASLKGVYILGASAVQVSHTGNTTETTLATIAVPANAMGANGVLRITTQWGYTGTNTKTPRIKFGGTTYHDTAGGTTQLSARNQVQIANRNSTSSQVGNASTQVNWGATTNAVVTSAENTTGAINITITGQLTNSGESIALESYLVELIVP